MAENEEKIVAEENATENAAEAKATENAAEATAAKPAAPAPKTPKKKNSKPLIIAGICVLALVVACLVTAFVSAGIAVSKYNAKEYDGAYSASKLAFFMDAKSKKAITKDYVINVVYKDGDVLKGADILAGLSFTDEELEKIYEKAPLLAMTKVGNVAKFATWEQDGDTSAEEPLEWVVLDTVLDGDTPRALLMSKAAFGASVFSRDSKNTTYSSSMLNSFCESDFYLSVNSDDAVKGKILKVNIKTEDSKAGMDSGDDVQVHAFAPSREDVEKYLINTDNETLKSFLIAEGTPALKKNGFRVSTNGVTGYWLRNAGEAVGFVSSVTNKGEIVEGSTVSSTANGVRVCMWVKLG